MGLTCGNSARTARCASSRPDSASGSPAAPANRPLTTVGRRRSPLVLLPRICHARTRHQPASGSPWSSLSAASQSWPPWKTPRMLTTISSDDSSSAQATRFYFLKVVVRMPDRTSSRARPASGNAKMPSMWSRIADTNCWAISADAGLGDPVVEILELLLGFGGVVDPARHERAAHLAPKRARTVSAGRGCGRWSTTSSLRSCGSSSTDAGPWARTTPGWSPSSTSCCSS